MAENYLQHAEHYNRIIATALAQQQAQRENREEEEEDIGDQGDNRFASNPVAQREQNEGEQQAFDGEQPQPVIQAPVQAVSSETEQPRESRPDRNANRAPVEHRTPAEPRASAENAEGEGFRSRRRERTPRPPRERTPRPPREPRVPAAIVAEGAEQPDEGGLLATLSRGADKPIVVTTED